MDTSLNIHSKSDLFLMDIPIRFWKVEDVIAWVENVICLPEYSRKFLRASVDGRLLLSLTERDLGEQGLGIMVPLHIKKFIIGISELQDRFNKEASAEVDISKVSEHWNNTSILSTTTPEQVLVLPRAKSRGVVRSSPASASRTSTNRISSSPSSSSSPYRAPASNFPTSYRYSSATNMKKQVIGDLSLGIANRSVIRNSEPLGTRFHSENMDLSAADVNTTRASIHNTPDSASSHNVFQDPYLIRQDGNIPGSHSMKIIGKEVPKGLPPLQPSSSNILHTQQQQPSSALNTPSGRSSILSVGDLGGSTPILPSVDRIPTFPAQPASINNSPVPTGTLRMDMISVIEQAAQLHPLTRSLLHPQQVLRLYHVFMDASLTATPGDGVVPPIDILSKSKYIQLEGKVGELRGKLTSVEEILRDLSHSTLSYSQFYLALSRLGYPSVDSVSPQLSQSQNYNILTGSIFSPSVVQSVVPTSAPSNAISERAFTFSLLKGRLPTNLERSRAQILGDYSEISSNAISELLSMSRATVNTNPGPTSFMRRNETPTRHANSSNIQAIMQSVRITFTEFCDFVAGSLTVGSPALSQAYAVSEARIKLASAESYAHASAAVQLAQLNTLRNVLGLRSVIPSTSTSTSTSTNVPTSTDDSNSLSALLAPIPVVDPTSSAVVYVSPVPASLLSQSMPLGVTPGTRGFLDPNTQISDMFSNMVGFGDGVNNTLYRDGCPLTVLISMVDGWMGPPGTDPWYQNTMFTRNSRNSNFAPPGVSMHSMIGSQVLGGYMPPLGAYSGSLGPIMPSAAADVSQMRLMDYDAYAVAILHKTTAFPLIPVELGHLYSLPQQKSLPESMNPIDEWNKENTDIGSRVRRPKHPEIDGLTQAIQMPFEPSKPPVGRTSDQKASESTNKPLPEYAFRPIGEGEILNDLTPVLVRARGQKASVPGAIIGHKLLQPSVAESHVGGIASAHLHVQRVVYAVRYLDLQEEENVPPDYIRVLEPSEALMQVQAQLLQTQKFSSVTRALPSKVEATSHVVVPLGERKLVGIRANKERERELKQEQELLLEQERAAANAKALEKLKEMEKEQARLKERELQLLKELQLQKEKSIEEERLKEQKKEEQQAASSLLESTALKESLPVDSSITPVATNSTSVDITAPASNVSSSLTAPPKVWDVKLFDPSPKSAIEPKAPSSESIGSVITEPTVLPPSSVFTPAMTTIHANSPFSSSATALRKDSIEIERVGTELNKAVERKYESKEEEDDDLISMLDMKPSTSVKIPVVSPISAASAAKPKDETVEKRPLFIITDSKENNVSSVPSSSALTPSFSAPSVTVKAPAESKYDDEDDVSMKKILVNPLVTENIESIAAGSIVTPKNNVTVILEETKKPDSLPSNSENDKEELTSITDANGKLVRIGDSVDVRSRGAGLEKRAKVISIFYAKSALTSYGQGFGLGGFGNFSFSNAFFGANSKKKVMCKVKFDLTGYEEDNVQGEWIKLVSEPTTTSKNEYEKPTVSTSLDSTLNLSSNSLNISDSISLNSSAISEDIKVSTSSQITSNSDRDEKSPETPPRKTPSVPRFESILESTDLKKTEASNSYAPKSVEKEKDTRRSIGRDAKGTDLFIGDKVEILVGSRGSNWVKGTVTGSMVLFGDDTFSVLLADGDKKEVSSSNIRLIDGEVDEESSSVGSPGSARKAKKAGSRSKTPESAKSTSKYGGNAGSRSSSFLYPTDSREMTDSSSAKVPLRDQTGKELHVGDKVEALFRGRGNKYIKGRLTHFELIDSTYSVTVLYDDGDKDQGLQPSHIRLLESMVPSIIDESEQENPLPVLEKTSPKESVSLSDKKTIASAPVVSNKSTVLSEQDLLEVSDEETDVVYPSLSSTQSSVGNHRQSSTSQQPLSRLRLEEISTKDDDPGAVSPGATSRASTPLEGPLDMNGVLLQVGDKVEAKFKGRGTKFYPGTISSITRNSGASGAVNWTVGISYDDGDKEEGAVGGSIRKVEQFTARTSGIIKSGYSSNSGLNSSRRSVSFSDDIGDELEWSREVDTRTYRPHKK